MEEVEILHEECSGRKRERMVIRMTVSVSGFIWLILISGPHPGDVHLIMRVEQSRGERGNRSKRPGEMVTRDG